jgi:glycosyltransferase involved in cell wall biosynthesis
MNILFYSPFNARSRDSESLILALKEQGHRLISLSQSEGKGIHPYLASAGVETFSYVVKSNNRLVYYIKHILYLIRFCKRNNVQIIYSHLETANFVAVIAQFFIKAKVVIFRHHVDEAALQGFDRSLFYKATYKLARRIVAVSNRSVNYMINLEGVDGSKINKINLGYDFSLYQAPNESNVETIRDGSSESLLLVSVGRLNKFKRLNLSMLVVKKLLDKGIDVRLHILGDGPELENLKGLIRDLHLNERVSLIGYVTNVIDYLQACDFVIHPSILESSCVTIKEAGLLNKPVVVCNDVGDFNEYIVNTKNGFVVSSNPEAFISETVDILVKYHSKKQDLSKIGARLNETITSLFSIENVIEHHTALIASLKTKV